jgi:hypothetical protein
VCFNYFIQQRKYNECFSAITSIHERVGPIIARAERLRDREKERSDRSKSEKKSEKKEDGKSGTTSVDKDKVEKPAAANVPAIVVVKAETTKKEVKEESSVADIETKEEKTEKEETL